VSNVDYHHGPVEGSLVGFPVHMLILTQLFTMEWEVSRILVFRRWDLVPKLVESAFSPESELDRA
jgi:hypothetical protein